MRSSLFPFLLTLSALCLPASFRAQAVEPNAGASTAVFGQPPPAARQEPLEKQTLSGHSDFYYLRDGQRNSFLRREGTFVAFGAPGAAASRQLSNDIESRFATDVDLVKKHSLRGRSVFKIKEGRDSESLLKQMRTSDPSITFISPLLVTERGRGEMGVLPSLVVRLSPSADLGSTLSSIEQNFNLSQRSQLRYSELEFEFQMLQPVSDIGEIFALVRSLGALATVEWAEPNIVVSSVSSFTPNDPQYPDQWHLNNTGQGGGAADADVDAPEGWDISQGSGVVITIFDDAVDVSHEDLPIWSNPGETGGGKETNGVDDDGNGFVDDYRGWDFGDDDNDPSPGAGDNHGTAVAGVAAAIGNNGVGVSGSAPAAQIMPVRTGSMSCTQWGNAMRYAGKYGHLVNNSWGISGCHSALDSAISDVVSGSVAGDNRGLLGTPVLFATGNSASGWRKYTLSGFSAGSYDFEWRFDKDPSVSEGYDTIWLDDITWPGGASEDFESDLVGGVPGAFTSGGSANWTVVSDGTHARGASGNSVRAGTITHNQQTSLYATGKSVGSGNLTFWVWVSSEYNYDFFELYVNGTRYFQYSPGQYGEHENAVSYPAKNPDTIAVGATTDGGPGGVEERTYYSQFGPEVDVVAGSSGGGQGITTTDVMGGSGYSTGNYYTNFGGTSSATPLTSGVVATMIAHSPSLTAAEIRNALRAGADASGPYAYPGGRNDYYGYGRVNLYGSLATGTCGDGTLDSGEECDDGNTNPDDCCSATCEFESAATICRSSAGVCDIAETCTGASDTCPADTLEPITTECRSAAGVCDAPDFCDGAAASCTADVKLASECRASAGVCDLAEVCDGVADECPTDAFEPITTECRSAAGVCDVPESCTGSDPSCPTDGYELAGTSCNDGDVCTENDQCDGAGICGGGLVTACEVPGLQRGSQLLLMALLAMLGGLLIATRGSIPGSRITP